VTSVLEQFPADVPDQPELVTCERDGDLVRLTLQRPEVMNCLSFPTLRRFRGLLEELAQDLTVRVVLITGAGERAFCAGADLKERRTMPVERVPDFVRNIRGLMDDVAALPQPTIAVINGVAFGGGTELMLACDLRVAAEDASFGLTETTLAILPGAGGTQRLPRLIGTSRAKDLILTGRKLDAHEAERIGLVNRAVPSAQLAEAARAWAAELAALPTIAIGYMKRNLNTGLHGSLAEVLDSEAIHMVRTFETDDHKGAAAAFVEKRAPRFNGR